MKARSPTVTLTRGALVIRIPWDNLRQTRARRATRPGLTAEEVSRLVRSGRRAYRLGKTRLISSLRELIP